MTKIQWFHVIILPVVVPLDRWSLNVDVPPVIGVCAIPLLVTREEPRAAVARRVGRLAVAEPGETRLELLVDDALHVLGGHTQMTSAKFSGFLIHSLLVSTKSTQPPILWSVQMSYVHAP